MGFEPTCPFTDNRISSAARYDHFDTAPCINFVLVSRFLERHSGENRFPPLLRRTPEALILLHFLTVSFLLKPVISSQSRYDHFDTAPYLSQHQHLGKRGELMGRTSKNIKLRIPEKPRKIKGFRLGSYRVATTISSAARYNHFDTLPCINIHFWGLIT